MQSHRLGSVVGHVGDCHAPSDRRGDIDVVVADAVPHDPLAGQLLDDRRVESGSGTSQDHVGTGSACDDCVGVVTSVAQDVFGIDAHNDALDLDVGPAGADYRHAHTCLIPPCTAGEPAPA